jgi:hypothetical protein
VEENRVPRGAGGAHGGSPAASAVPVRERRENKWFT